MRVLRLSLAAPGAASQSQRRDLTFHRPPPAPGVPPGPTQAELSPYTAPVCDAAKFVKIFAPANNNRQFVEEHDQVAAKAVGGTLIHRAWSLQNIGTCTWGPGYELSFYGGRNMGSGGVAFESSFPTEPARRNILIDNNFLIAPEGKPNQTANLEVLLTVPTTPGIHQSYWRMRNPHGVYFGPVLGVTLDITRNCPLNDGTNNDPSQPTVYGAPTIRKFVVPGFGNAIDSRTVTAKEGQDLILEWNIVNATNFDIVFTDPTGNIETVSTSDPNSRATFPTSVLGDHLITLYADNGICTSDPPAEIKVKVIPEAGAGFNVNVAFANNAPISSSDVGAAFSSSVQPGTVEVQWQHVDEDVDEVALHIDRFRKRKTTSCALEDWVGDLFCSDSEEWQKVGSERVMMGTQASGGATVCQESATCRNISQGNFPVEITANDHASLIFCPATSSTEETGVQFYAEAHKDGAPVQLQFSNTVDIRCLSANGGVGPNLEFNPDN